MSTMPEDVIDDAPWLEELPEAWIPTSDPPLTDEQSNALDVIQRWFTLPKHQRMWMSLTGPAGVGKTHVLRKLKPLIADPIWAAMTGKAASRMREAAGVMASTLHRTLYLPPQVEDDGTLTFDLLRDPPYESVLVIDEASMITPAIAAALRRWTNEYAVRILFVGDGFQLPPVISKEEIRNGVSEDYSVFAELSGPGLTRVMRTGNAILDAITMLRTKAKLPTQSRGAYTFGVENDPLDRAVSEYIEDPIDHALITWTNRTRMTANQIIRHRLGHHGEVPHSGEPILICKNAPGGSVLNGEVYTIGTIERGEDYGVVPTYRIVTACGKAILAHGWSWNGEPPRIEDRDDWRRYRSIVEHELTQWVWNRQYGGTVNDMPPEPLPVTYGHALTAHKAQGSEYRRVTVFMPKIDNTSSHFRKPTELPDGTKIPFGVRFFYTAVSRAKEQLSVLVGR